MLKSAFLHCTRMRYFQLSETFAKNKAFSFIFVKTLVF